MWKLNPDQPVELLPITIQHFYSSIIANADTSDRLAMLVQPEKLNDTQRSTVEKLCQLFPQIEMARELALEFDQIVQDRLPNQFNGWLFAAMQSKLKEFVSFARGLDEDYVAVINALRHEWSNGQLEGQVNRLKLIKRQMYGRAQFDLLRSRVLHSIR